MKAETKDIQEAVESALLTTEITLSNLYDMYGVTRHEWIEALRGKRMTESRLKLRTRLIMDARESNALKASVLRRAK